MEIKWRAKGSKNEYTFYGTKTEFKAIFPYAVIITKR
jgi:hypothetical protein